MKKRRSNKYILLLAAATFFILFFIFTFIVKSKSLDQFDFDTTVRIQNHLPRRFDPILSFFSLIGSFEIISIFIAILLILFKKLRAILIIGLYGGAHIVEIFGKYFMHHPGPPFLFFRYDINFLFPSSYVQTGSSYPSGHSLRSVFFTILFIFFLTKFKKLNKWVRVLISMLAIGLCFVMLLSRISLGEHWTTDVIGGSLMGLAIGFSSLLLL